MRTNRALVSVPVVLLCVGVTSGRAYSGTIIEEFEYDANLGPFMGELPLGPIEYMASLDTVDIELVALTLVSSKPVGPWEVDFGDTGGPPGMPGDMGFGDFLPFFFLPPFGIIDLIIRFEVTEPSLVPIELEVLDLTFFEPDEVLLEYEYDSIYGPILERFDFRVPEKQPLDIIGASIDPVGTGIFDLNLSVQSSDFLLDDLPILEFTLTGGVIPAPGLMAVFGVAGLLGRRRRRERGSVNPSSRA